MERIAPMVDSFSTMGVVVPFPGTPLYDDNHVRYGFTGWWLDEAYSRYSAVSADRGFAPVQSLLHRRRQSRPRLLPLQRQMRDGIRACLRIKGEHNLRQMGLLPDPVFEADPGAAPAAVATPGGMTGWDHPDTVRYYEAFNRRHTRYRTANRALVRHAQLRPGLRVLDFAAGTGGTTAAALDILGADGRVDCVEPAQAMRTAGMQKFDARVRWFADLESAGTGYERILCGAAIWQVPNVAACIRALAERLAPGGALCFDIPAAYAGEADPPGRGPDPLLTELPAALARLGAGGEPQASAPVTLARREDLHAALSACGLVPCSWRFVSRLTQRAYRDWLKIPVLTDQLLGSLDADQRAAAIDAASAETDPASWRREHWLGWTAWRPPFALGLLHDASAEHCDPVRLRHRALREGYVFLPRLLPRAAVMALRRQAISDLPRARAARRTQPLVRRPLRRRIRYRRRTPTRAGCGCSRGCSANRSSPRSKTIRHCAASWRTFWRPRRSAAKAASADWRPRRCSKRRPRCTATTSTFRGRHGYGLRGCRSATVRSSWGRSPSRRDRSSRTAPPICPGPARRCARATCCWSTY